MNKDKFNKLSILQQIDFINSQLQNNKSITSVCKSIGISRSTIRDRFKKENYVYIKDLNKYSINKENSKHENNICSTSVMYNKDSTNLIESNTILNLPNQLDKEFQKNIIDLVNNYDVLKEIIELHKRNTSVIKTQITIDLDDSENKLTTLRVNKSVLENFNEFCKKNSQFTKVDLFSQALKEFMELHS